MCIRDRIKEEKERADRLREEYLKWDRLCHHFGYSSRLSLIHIYIQHENSERPHSPSPRTIHTRSVSTGITTGEVTAILANAPVSYTHLEIARLYYRETEGEEMDPELCQLMETVMQKVKSKNNS